MEQAETYQKVKNKLADRWWRLNNLYYIKDKQGQKVKFKLNWAQKDFYENLHYFNVILKARQLGFTTFCMIYFLDACLFNSDHTAGVIAHTQNDAIDLFDNKIKYAYDNLPAWLKEARPTTSDNARKLVVSNGSQIYTGTSLRSGTLQKLLVSEYGKISAKYPDKAKEIKTGALNTVDSGQQIFVESTAEGRIGEFYSLYETARKNTDAGRELTPLDPKGFFYPWYKNPEYSLKGNITISQKNEEYFSSLANMGLSLTAEQKAWYEVKSRTQGEDMMQEYPTIQDEAFQGSLQGAFYTDQFRELRAKKQICHVPYDSRFQVHTWWDLGLNDMMSIWFHQYIEGKHCFIDYHESSLESWSYYSEMLSAKGYNYAKHHFPHDGKKRVRGQDQIFTDMQMAQNAGITPIDITPRTDNTYNDIMNACLPILPLCFFDEQKCSAGLIHLENYRRRWNNAEAMWMKEPLHDEASHCADAFRTFAVNADLFGRIKKEDPYKNFYQDPYRNTGATGWMGA